nr:hypothetical protein [Tanacetum cinerariifolium]
MIATPREPDLPVPIPESFHEQTDEELTETDIKRMDANDQAIQTILLGLPKDIYAAVDSCETTKEIWERVRQMMKGLDIGEQEKKAKIFNEWEKFTSTDGIANQSGTSNVVAARAEGIQLQAEEFDFMAAAGNLDEIEEVNPNSILMVNLQQASTSGTQHDMAPVYDTDSSAEVQLNDNCYDNEIFNMFTQEEQYTNLLEPIREPQLVPQNDNHVTFIAPSTVQSGGTIETSFAPCEETRAHQETVYRNLVEQVAQVNMINCNMRATNAELKSKLARYKIQEQHVEISQEKYEKLEKYKFLDKEVDLKARIKDPENIPLKRDQTVQTMHMLNPKPGSFYHPNQKMALEETLELAQESHEKRRLLKKEIKPANYAKINHLSGDLSNDTIPSVAQKFLNEVKSSLVTLQRVVKQKMTLEVHNWSSSAHKEVHRIISHEIAPIINQVDARVQNFEIQFLISYDKAYNDMQQKVKRLQAQLRDLKGKCSNTPSVSNTLDPLNQKLESKIVELEFQVVNYEREISHLKTTYKNLFDSIKSNREHAKLHDLIFENAKLRARLFEKTSESMKNT